MKYEKKFFTLAFLIIFSLLLLLIVIVNKNSYEEYKSFLLSDIKKQLEICSYKLNCKNIDIDFVKKNNSLKTFSLIETDQNLYMLFDIPNIKKYYLKLTITKKEYLKKLDKIKKKVLISFLIDLSIVLVLSLIFTYILYIPLKQAYNLNETFIKDILHDLNTPLTTLKMNLYLLKKECKSKKIDDIEKNISMILKKEENLKNYLNKIPQQISEVDLKEIINDIVNFYSSSYPDIKVQLKGSGCKLKINKTSFYSILDNIISNAFKYNKPSGYIKIYLKNKKLFIEDSGIGIKNPKKVFDRFYKENERGIGIGMNIVKKLSKELNINIEIFSQPGKGTKVVIDLKEYC